MPPRRLELSLSRRLAVTPTPPWVWKVAPYWPTAILIPAAVLSGVLARGRDPRSRRRLAPAVAAAAALGLGFWQLGRLFNEHPTYELERRIGPLEIRRYAPRVVAETTVEEGDWSQAVSEGFRRLARYIFGDNEGRRRIAMTTPVTGSATRVGAEDEAGVHEGTRIAMTSPVTVVRDVDGARHVVAFTMPREHDLASLPQPHDARIDLREVPGGRVAALRFHGSYRRRTIAPKEAELLGRVQDAGLTPIGVPVFAGYDAPSTLPLLRRLEVWVEVA